MLCFFRVNLIYIFQYQHLSTINFFFIEFDYLPAKALISYTQFVSRAIDQIGIFLSKLIKKRTFYTNRIKKNWQNALVKTLFDRVKKNYIEES